MAGPKDRGRRRRPVALPRRGRGQVLIIFAVLVPALVLLFLFALGVMALLDVRAHASYCLGVATRAAAREVDYSAYGSSDVRFNDRVPATTKLVFSDSLALRTVGLADTPEAIAEAVDVRVGYGSQASPWPSPFVAGRLHPYPTVSAQALVPVRVWVFEVTLRLVSETEVR